MWKVSGSKYKKCNLLSLFSKNKCTGNDKNTNDN